MSTELYAESMWEFQMVLTTIFLNIFLLGFLYPVMHFGLDTSVFQCKTALILYVYCCTYLLSLTNDLILPNLSFSFYLNKSLYIFF